MNVGNVLTYQDLVQTHLPWQGMRRRSSFLSTDILPCWGSLVSVLHHLLPVTRHRSPSTASNTHTCVLLYPQALLRPNMKIGKEFSYFKQKLLQKFHPVLSFHFGLLRSKGKCYRHEFFCLLSVSSYSNHHY